MIVNPMSNSILSSGLRKRRRGRQSLYTPELAALICERIAHGESLVAISGKRGLPSYQTIMEWLKAHSDFEAMYRQAREDQADTLADEIIAIADSVKDAGPADSAKVNAARLRVDARNGWPPSSNPRSTATALKRR